MKFAYTVAVSFNDEAIAKEWLEWMRSKHLQEVVDVGHVVRAEIIWLDGGGWRFEARYTFPSREAFSIYEREHAPRLRAEGVEKFPTTRGVTYGRTTAEILLQL